MPKQKRAAQTLSFSDRMYCGDQCPSLSEYFTGLAFRSLLSDTKHDQYSSPVLREPQWYGHCSHFTVRPEVHAPEVYPPLHQTRLLRGFAAPLSSRAGQYSEESLFLPGLVSQVFSS